MAKNPTLPIPQPSATNPQDRQWQAAVTEMLNLRSNNRPNSAAHAWVSRGEMEQALGTATDNPTGKVSYETIMSAVKTVDGKLQDNIAKTRENTKSIEDVSQKLFGLAYGVATHGVETVIDGVFLQAPKVFVFPDALPTYDPSQQDKRQIQRLGTGDVVSKGSGQYAFTPQAELVAESVAEPTEAGGEPEITITQITTGAVFYIAMG